MTQTEIKQTKLSLYCPECDQESGVIDSITGDLICDQCGLVLSDDDVQIDLSYKPPAFNREERIRKRHTGPLVTPRSINLSTSISHKNHLHSLSARKKQKYSRLRKINRSITTSKERAYSDSLKLLRPISSILHLPYFISDFAFLLFKKAREKDLIMGRSTADVLAASIFIASRKFNFPLTLETIVDSSQFIRSQRTVFTAIRTLVETFNLPYNRYNKEDNSKNSGKEANILSDRSIFLSKACSTLNVPNLESKLVKLLKILPCQITSGKNPRSVFAGALYFLHRRSKESKIRLTQKSIADVFEISEPTVRSRFNDIKQWYLRVKQQKEGSK